MRIALLLVVLLMSAPAAFAQAGPSPDAAPAAVTQLTAEEAPAAAQEVAEPQRAEERRTEKNEAREQIAQRGSFWWLVGVIVVAGVLLAVLLD